MHNAFGALTSLASLQAIAAMQGAANLSSAGGIAALGGNLDFVNNINRHASIGGLGGLGINQSKPACHVQFIGSIKTAFVLKTHYIEWSLLRSTGAVNLQWLVPSANTHFWASLVVQTT